MAYFSGSKIEDLPLDAVLIEERQVVGNGLGYKRTRDLYETPDGDRYSVITSGWVDADGNPVQEKKESTDSIVVTQKSGRYTAKQYAQVLNVTASTARKKLNKLVVAGKASVEEGCVVDHRLEGEGASAVRIPVYGKEWVVQA